MPIEDASLQPARCRLARPRSAQGSQCTKQEQERRWFLHETKGCKRFGICPQDAMVHDQSDEQNYFQSYEECQKECMGCKCKEYRFCAFCNTDIYGMPIVINSMPHCLCLLE